MSNGTAMIGKRLGHYVVLELLGSGGMGVVYRAKDEQLGREVALKVLRPDAPADQAGRARLLHEARMASALNHPHICTIHEIGEAGSLTYIAMEHVSGKTLKQLIPPGGFPVETVVRYGAQIADALAHAHSRGIMHRDLKSSNVVITGEGRAKVLDFGLARCLEGQIPDEDTRSEATPFDAQTPAGTLPYMAPETLRSEEADARADLWSLGVILSEMAAGRLPFQGRTNYELSSAILREPPQGIAGVAPALRAVIQRCLAKDRQQRYQQAAELRVALETVQSAVAAGVPLKPRRGARKAIDSLAVLPFENATADPESEYLGDGITENLIHSLAQVPKLRVMARSAVFRYKGQQPNPQAIGHELNVRAVLTGRVLQRGDTLVISTELVDVANGWQLWGETYNRKLTDIFTVQEEIAREISGKLRLRLSREEKKKLTKRHTQNSEAYQFYLRGRFHWNKRTKESLERGVEYFNLAVEKDPNYALAYAGLADSYYLLGGTAYGGYAPRSTLLKARAAAAKALELDDSLAEAHVSLGAVLLSDWQWLAAEASFQRAIQLNPGYATAHHWYSDHLIAMNRLEEALAENRRALELDPLSVIINRDLALTLYFARQYDESIEQLRKTLELDPGFALAHQALGRVYLAQGLYDKAIAQIQKGVEFAPDSSAMISALAHAYGVAQRPAEARQKLEELFELAKRSYVTPMHIAIAYMGLGETEKTYEWLEKAHREHSIGLMTLAVHPIFDPLRSDARYHDLMRRVGLPA